MTSDLIFRLSEGCLAQEFRAQVQSNILGTLPTPAYLESIVAAKYDLQELYHQYRRSNPCQATAFGRLHECVYHVYLSTYDRLDAMEMHAKPAPRPRRRRELPRAEEDLISQIAGLRERIVGDAKSQRADSLAIEHVAEEAGIAK